MWREKEACALIVIRCGHPLECKHDRCALMAVFVNHHTAMRRRTRLQARSDAARALLDGSQTQPERDGRSQSGMDAAMQKPIEHAKLWREHVPIMERACNHY